MYTKNEASIIKEQFWKTFGQYMSHVPNAEGILKINWINYKTGIKSIQIKMHADKKEAYIALSIFHKNEVVQELIWEKLLSLRPMIQSIINEDWHWFSNKENENHQIVAGIFKNISKVNVMNQQDWPSLITFFKANIIILDALWHDIRFAFDEFKYA